MYDDVEYPSYRQENTSPPQCHINSIVILELIIKNTTVAVTYNVNDVMTYSAWYSTKSYEWQFIHSRKISQYILVLPRIEIDTCEIV